jgi:hypothetical protein
VNIQKIDLITVFTANTKNYFNQSSWHGRTVQILSVATGLLLLYLLWTRLKSVRSPGFPVREVANNKSQTAPAPAAPKNSPRAESSSSPIAAPASPKDSPRAESSFLPAASAPSPATPKDPIKAENSSSSPIAAPASPKDSPGTIDTSPLSAVPAPVVPQDTPRAESSSPSPSEDLSVDPARAVELLKTVVAMDDREEVSDKDNVVDELFTEFHREIAETTDRCPKWNEKIQSDLQKTHFIGGLRRSVAEVHKVVEKWVENLRQVSRAKGYSLESWKKRLQELRVLNQNLVQKKVNEKELDTTFQELLANIKILDHSKLEALKKTRIDESQKVPQPLPVPEEPQNKEAAPSPPEPNPVPEPAQPQEQPKPAASLARPTEISDIVMKDLFTEFQIEIEGLITQCPKWNESMQSDTSKANFRRQFRPFIKQATQIIENFFKKLREDSRLKAYSLVAWETTLKDIQKLNDALGTDAPESTLYQTFMSLMANLKVLEETRQEALKTALVTELKQIPLHQFSELNEYLPHLKLNSEDSQCLGKQENWLFAYGIHTMEDLDVLKLRSFEPSIHILRQLCCYLEFARGEEKISPLLSLRFKEEIVILINKVKEPCFTGYAEEENILKDICSILNDMLSAPYTKRSIGKLFSDLDIISMIDKGRQIVLLNAYINQYGARLFWKKSYENEVYTLSQYYQNKNLRDPYRIGVNS